MKKLREILRVATRVTSMLILCLTITIAVMKDISIQAAQVLLLLSVVALLGLHITKK